MLVLITDDDPVIRDLISWTLSSEGFGVATAANGVEALDQLERARPDAVVLDLSMPLMDGRAFVRAMRARGEDVPVLLVSGSDVERAADELGVEAALAKPFELSELVDRVRAVSGAATG